MEAVGAYRIQDRQIPESERLEVELGCGLGSFAVGKAQQNPHTLIIAFERNGDALVRALEQAKRLELANVLFVWDDVSKLREYFLPGQIDRFYINFCEPWPARRHWRRRLTAPAFLNIYKTLLKPGGQLFFKTDDAPLYTYSLKTLTEAGWNIVSHTADLHGKGPRPDSDIWTEYERKFHDKGVPICRIEAAIGSEGLSSEGNRHEGAN